MDRVYFTLSIEDIEQLNPETRKNFFFLIDNVIQNFKTKQTFSLFLLIPTKNIELKKRTLNPPQYKFLILKHLP